jgi:hypothetical protein
MQGFGFGLPLVESARNANGGGCGMSEFKANGHERGAGAADVVMVMVVFHNRWFIGTVDFRFRENVSFHITIMHPKTLRRLWGVTLPNIIALTGQRTIRQAQAQILFEVRATK